MSKLSCAASCWGAEVSASPHRMVTTGDPWPGSSAPRGLVATLNGRPFVLADPARLTSARPDRSESLTRPGADQGLVSATGSDHGLRGNQGDLRSRPIRSLAALALVRRHRPHPGPLQRSRVGSPFRRVRTKRCNSRVPVFQGPAALPLMSRSPLRGGGGGGPARRQADAPCHRPPAVRRALLAAREP